METSDNYDKGADAVSAAAVHNSSEFSRDVSRLLNDLLGPRYKNIWLFGSAVLAKEFIRLNLVDDIRLVIMPIILGGVLFMDTGSAPWRS